VTETEFIKQMRRQHRREYDRLGMKFALLADYAAERAGLDSDTYMEQFRRAMFKKGLGDDIDG
jgi:hypothetical protein